MIDPAHVPPVDPQEMLARYVLYGRYVRSSDQTVRPEAFIPHPHVDLSVTRHRQASEAETTTIQSGGVSLRVLTKCIAECPPLEAKQGEPGHVAACWVAK